MRNQILFDADSRYDLDDVPVSAFEHYVWPEATTAWPPREAPDRLSPDRRTDPTKSLRIAMFVNEFPALSETFVLNQITGLMDLGHEVTIFANGKRGDPTVHPDVRRYHLADHIRYRNMPKDRRARLLRVPGLLAQHGMRDLRSEFAAMNPFAFGREAASLNLLYWANRLLSEQPFDIIHCHFGTIGRVAAFLREIGAISGKLVTTFHGVDMSACLADDPNLYRHLFDRGDLFLPISDHWRQRLIEIGCPPDRIAVHRMGIDPSRFPVRARSRNSGRPFGIVSVGRLVEKKGMEYGLRAIAELCARQIPLRYTIVGDGPLGPKLKSLTRELGIEHCVTFMGWARQEEIIEVLGDNEVLIAPSVTDRNGDQEGIPVTLMEAMASGMPVVSTRHSGIPELVQDGISGFLFAERNVSGMAKALDRLWSDPALCRRMGTAACIRVQSMHDIESLNRQLVRRFRALL